MLNLDKFSRILVIACVTFIAATAPLALKAQEDESQGDVPEETIIPGNPGSSAQPVNPPIIMDESDSGATSDVGDYDE